MTQTAVPAVFPDIGRRFRRYGLQDVGSVCIGYVLHGVLWILQARKWRCFTCVSRYRKMFLRMRIATIDDKRQWIGANGNVQEITVSITVCFSFVSHCFVFSCIYCVVFSFIYSVLVFSLLYSFLCLF